MKRPTPPFLELGFYYSERRDADAYALLINTLISLGATFTGEVLFHYGRALRAQPFVRLYDFAAEKRLISLNDLRSMLTDPNIRVIETYMKNAVGLAKNNAEIITYINHENEKSAFVDHHPLVIWTEGTLFESHHNERERQNAIKGGEIVYHRFKDIILCTNPTYASIASECALLCPTDLAIQSNTYVFLDCYLSYHYMNPLTISRFISSYRDVYFERLANGIYCSCSNFFNPVQKNTPLDQAYNFSCELSKLIAEKVEWVAESSGNGDNE